MEKITDNDLAMFKERSRTELRSNCDVSRLAWDNVVPALCNEVVALRKVKTEQENMLKRCRAFVVASDLADAIDDVLNLTPENAQCPTNGLTFGQAIDAMKLGKKVARKGWNGKGMWLCIPLVDGPKEIPATGIWGKPNAEYAEQNGDTVKVMPFITMKAADGSIVMGWLASQTDMLAEDWMIVE